MRNNFKSCCPVLTNVRAFKLLHVTFEYNIMYHNGIMLTVKRKRIIPGIMNNVQPTQNSSH